MGGERYIRESNKRSNLLQDDSLRFLSPQLQFLKERNIGGIA